MTINNIKFKEKLADNSNKHYVSNKILYPAMCKYKEDVLANKKPKIPEEIGLAIKLIAERIGTMPKFNQYTYKDEMISDGILNCLKYIDNFDHTKYNNPFAYFSRTILNAFIHRIKKEQKQQYLKYKNYINDYYYEELRHNERHDIKSNDISFEIIQKYEDSLKKKK